MGSRRVPMVGDAVLVRHLASDEPGRITAVEGHRVLVETGTVRDRFELSRITGRFERAGEAYSPRLIWDDEAGQT